MRMQHRVRMVCANVNQRCHMLNESVGRRSLPPASIRRCRRAGQWQYRGVSDHQFWPPAPSRPRPEVVAHATGESVGNHVSHPSHARRFSAGVSHRFDSDCALEHPVFLCLHSGRSRQVHACSSDRQPCPIPRTRCHHASHCGSVLGPVKALRYAPPTRVAWLRALTGPARSSRIAVACWPVERGRTKRLFDVDGGAEWRACCAYLTGVA